MTVRIRTFLVAMTVAGLLAAPVAEFSSIAPGAVAKQRHHASISAAPRQDDVNAHHGDDGQDIGDGDHADSCSVDDSGVEYCSGELIVSLIPGSSIAAVQAAIAEEDDVTVELKNTIEGANLFLLGFSVPNGDAVSERDLIKHLLDVEINDVRPVRWVELNYVGNAPQGNPSRFFPRDTGKPQAAANGASWGKAKTGATQAATCADGRGEIVAVIDTGIDRTHPAFAGRLLTGWNAFDGSATVDDVGNGLNDDGDFEYGTTTELIDEAVGHGTHVSGIVLQAAPRATILPIKALDSDGSGQAFYLARAIAYASARHANVINLSLGSTGNSRAVAEAVQRAQQLGILVVAAAGNDGAAGKPEYPAALSGVIAIGATDRNDRPANFNSTASGIDFVAPGVDIASAFPLGGQGVNSRYAVWSGSSMATPWVSGAAADLGSRNSTWSASRIVSRLTATTTPIRGGGVGSGRVNIAAAAACRCRSSA
ncbi:MAG: S8 family serine peptidase [Thermomicrobiales bacterium]